MENNYFLQLQNELPYLSKELLLEIRDSCEVVSFTASTQIIRLGQYIQVIPIVLKGVVKVLSQKEDKEVLLYYIQPNESCVMSFASGFKNEPSPIFALVEEEATMVLLPIKKVLQWLKRYPEINTLFYQQYNQRYQDLLTTINHLIFDKLDVRVYEYLAQKATILNTQTLKISHRQIASDIGTAREVVSRIIKKLELEGKIIQNTNTVTLL